MPWTIAYHVPGWQYGYRAIIDSDGFTVCDPSPMGDKNAALIAAAPDLLAALEFVARDLNTDMPAETAAIVRNAIRQAKGE